MRIEVTSIIEFDPVREQERIEGAFAGQPKLQERLRAVLDRFVAGDFDALSHEVALWSREEQQFLHPKVFDVLAKVRVRMQTAGSLEAIIEQRKTLSSTAAMLADYGGQSSPEMAAEYPRFRIL